MIRVKYPNSHGLDGMVHTMEIKKAYSLNKSDDSVLLECDEHGKDVIVHIEKIDGKWVNVPHNSREYTQLQFDALATKKSVTRGIKLELDKSFITNLEEMDFDFSTPTESVFKSDKNITVYVYQDHKYIDFNEAVSLRFVNDTDKDRRIIYDNMFLNDGLPSHFYELTSKDMDFLNSNYSVHYINLNVKINHIDIYNDENTANITYCDGKTIVISDELELEKIIEEFARQEMSNIKDLYRVGKIGFQKKEKNLIPASDTSDNKKNGLIPVTEMVEDDGVKNKKNGKKVFVKLTSLATAVALGFISGGYFLNKNRDSKKSDNPKTYTIVTEKPNISETIVPSVTDNVHLDRLTRIVKKMYDGERISEDDLKYAMDEINSRCYKGIPGIMDLLSGGKMSGSREEINFYDMFPEDSYEYFVIRYYCNSRDDLMKNAYLQRLLTTKDDVTYFMNTICDFTFNGSTVPYEGKQRNIYDLAPIARYMIVCLGKQTLLADPTYKCRINGRSCNYDQIMDEYVEMHRTVTERLANNSVRKK